MQMTPKYMGFYVDGLTDPLDDGELDVGGLAEMSMNGKDTVHAIVSRAVGAIAAPLEHDRERREWIEENKEPIDAAGGDGAMAYSHYLAGRTDATVHQVEDEVLELLCEEAAGDDDDEDPDDDEDEDEDEEEDDEED